MRAFWGALQFLTRVPVRLRDAPDLAACAPWFPLVGAIVGLAVGATAAGLGELVPGGAAAAVAICAGMLITGAFHEDGLADFADAIGGGSTVEDRLRILDDPRLGTYGVAALAGSIVVRVACVASLAPAAAIGGLVAAHALSRGAAVATMATVPPARPEGLGARSTAGLSRNRALAGIALAVALGAVATGWWVGPLVAAAAVAAGALALVARRAIGGSSGDVLGAIEQVVECVVMVTVTGLAARHSLWWR